jgi:HEPN domain-containing protein
LNQLPDLIASYLQLADENLRDARLLKATGSRASVYHYSQASELLFRAVMSANNIRIPYNETHLTNRMWHNLPDGQIKAAMKSMTWLDGYATCTVIPLTAVK